MAQSSLTPWIDSYRNVKAWCMTGYAKTNGAYGGTFTNTPNQLQFDTINYCDGFNLRIHVDTQLLENNAANTSEDRGAIKFTFIEPMKDTKYKVFVKGMGNLAGTIFHPHMINDPIRYPKTKQGFYIRAMAIQNLSAVQVYNYRLHSPYPNSNQRLMVVVI